jgi:hypothetical protein
MPDRGPSDGQFDDFILLPLDDLQEVAIDSIAARMACDGMRWLPI